MMRGSVDNLPPPSFAPPIPRPPKRDDDMMISKMPGKQTQTSKNNTLGKGCRCPQCRKKRAENAATTTIFTEKFNFLAEQK